MPPGTQWLRKHKFADPGRRHHSRSRAAIHLPRHVMRALLAICLAAVSACGLAYYSPRVAAVDSDAGKIRVIAITPQSLIAANLQPYTPRALPAVFSANAGTGAIRATGALPQPVLAEPAAVMAQDMRLPPPFEPEPYIIGIGDVVLLATPDIGTSPGGIAGQLAAPDRRQGYTVQGDGAIAIPDAGRVQIAGISVADAEARIFHHLVENQIEPAFSLEIAEFNSARISVGGAVLTPGVTPVTLVPLTLNQALTGAGGATTQTPEYTTIRLFREGRIYQIPLNRYRRDPGLQNLNLKSGDAVFVDQAYDPETARAWFDGQIRLADL